MSTGVGSYDFVQYTDGGNGTDWDRLDRGKWQSIVFLESDWVRESFVTATEIPSALMVATCGMLAEHDGRDAIPGVYDCATGTWRPGDGRCCARGESGCAAGLATCVALVVESPMYDLGQNERTIFASRLPIQIVYADVEAAVDFALAQSRPVLLYHWEPSGFMRTHGPFVRVSMTPYEYCSSSAGKVGHTDAIVIGGSASACDFPFQYVEKAVSDRLHDFSDVAFFVGTGREQRERAESREQTAESRESREQRERGGRHVAVSLPLTPSLRVHPLRKVTLPPC